MFYPFGVVWVINYVDRRRLRRSCPGLARALARRRWWLLAWGWALFIYLPSLLIGSCLGSGLGAMTHPGHSHFFPAWWIPILLAVIALPGRWYIRTILASYMSLLKRAAQNGLPAAQPSPGGTEPDANAA
jgi:hypothetical protein